MYGLTIFGALGECCIEQACGMPDWDFHVDPILDIGGAQAACRRTGKDIVQLYQDVTDGRANRALRYCAES